MERFQNIYRAIGKLYSGERPSDRILFLAFLAAGAVIAWKAVSWAIGPGFYLCNDELGNLARVVTARYSDILNLFPLRFYNDRPVGLAIERALYDAFGLHYRSQLLWYLVLHFTNCVLAYALFVRLDIDKRLALVGIAVFAGLSTTAQTATYIGAAFDVTCTLFALGTLIATLQRRYLLSAVLFLFALRSKEFAVALPLLSTLLAIHQDNDWSPGAWLRAVRRLWMQWAVLLVIGIRYLTFLPKVREVAASDPYRLTLSPTVFLQALAHYVGLMFGQEDVAAKLPLLVFALLCGVAVYGMVRRRVSIWFGVVACIGMISVVCLLPNIRSIYYVYGPQVFLLLALSGVAQDVIWTLLPAARWRQVAVACVGIAVLGQVVAFRRSPYFRNRINYVQNERRTCAITARTVSRLSTMGPATHVYINHGMSLPYLFYPGPCDYFKLITPYRDIVCVLNKPESDLLALYRQDTGEKVFLDYAASGYVVIRSHENSRAHQNP